MSLSLRAIGIKPADEVILPANSYPTAFAVAASGARIRLVDINPYTYTIDHTQIEKHLTSATKAIIPVHLYGGVCDLDPILRIAKKHKLFVVEDACQARGFMHKGRKFLLKNGVETGGPCEKIFKLVQLVVSYL